MSYSGELIDATEQVFRCLEKSGPNKSPKYIAEGLRISCQALTALMADPEFYQFLQAHTTGAAAERTIEAVNVLRHKSEELERFLGAERDVLLAAGFPPS